MISIPELIEKAKATGYDEANAESKVCQDIILALISQSHFSDHITVKGGVVMRSITNDSRRATQDMDMDFIKYSLQDESIERFVEKLNGSGVASVKMVGPIEELRQQDYHGKRIHVEITDGSGHSLKSKIDLGVHKHYDIQQEEYCFDVGVDEEGVCLLINSREQMFTEKLRSILKFGQFSTRYKDIFDMYYLSQVADPKKLLGCFDVLIFSDPGMRENSVNDIVKRMKSTFASKPYVRNLKNSRKNWLETDVDKVLSELISYLSSVEESQ